MTPDSNGRQALDLVEVRHRQDVHDLVDDYVSWREACRMASAALDNWKCTGRHEGELLFSEYIAALNCEEEAATVYQQAVEQLAAFTPARPR